MNTVDALNVLGKALCGDSFEVKPGLTDAETILEIAKNYEGGGSDDGGGSGVRVIDVSELTPIYNPTPKVLGAEEIIGYQYEPGLDEKDFAVCYVVETDINGDEIIVSSMPITIVEKYNRNGTTMISMTAYTDRHIFNYLPDGIEAGGFSFPAGTLALVPSDSSLGG